MCVHNAGRSQMAAGLMAHRAQGTVHVRSAGSDPAEQINPAVVEAHGRARHRPRRGVSEAADGRKAIRDADAVVTMGCDDACPIYPGKRYLDWELPDPSGQDLETVRAIRDEIDARVQRLLAELVPSRQEAVTAPAPRR